jgi:hypothetical protein
MLTKFKIDEINNTSKVFHISCIKKYLLSIGAITNVVFDVKLEFFQHMCLVRNIKTRTIVLRGRIWG